MKIDVNRNDDIEHWARSFGVSRARLIAAIAASGPKVDDVEARIRRERERQHKSDEPANLRTVEFHLYD